MTSINPSSNSLDTSKIVFPTDLEIKTPEQKQVYASALEFERYFVQQLLKPMQDAGKMLGNDEEGSSGTAGYSDLAQDQMTQSVLDGGGLGIASTLYTQMAEAAGITTAPATTTAPTAANTAAAAKAGDAA